MQPASGPVSAHAPGLPEFHLQTPSREAGTEAGPRYPVQGVPSASLEHAGHTLGTFLPLPPSRAWLVNLGVCQDSAADQGSFIPNKAGKGHGCAAGSLSDPGDTVHAERRLLKAEGPDRRKQRCSWTGGRPRPAPALPGGIQQPSAQEAPLGGQRFDAGKVEAAGWCCAGEEACGRSCGDGLGALKSAGHWVMGPGSSHRVRVETQAEAPRDPRVAELLGRVRDTASRPSQQPMGPVSCQDLQTSKPQLEGRRLIGTESGIGENLKVLDKDFRITAANKIRHLQEDVTVNKRNKKTLTTCTCRVGRGRVRHGAVAALTLDATP